jgi:hypothetical protein
MFSAGFAGGLKMLKGQKERLKVNASGRLFIHARKYWVAVERYTPGRG